MLEDPPPGFEWDSTKATQNIIKHQVSFGEAVTIFDDPVVSVRSDDLHSWGEDRLLATGRSAAGRLLTVSYTMRGEVTRIVSAWPATSEAMRRYKERNGH